MIVIGLSSVINMDIDILGEVSTRHGNIPMVYSIHEPA